MQAVTGAPSGAARARRRDFPLRRRALARGAPDRIRTCGLLLRRQTLYPLSYRGPRPDSTSAGPVDRNRAAAPIAVSSVTPRPRRCARRRAASSGQVLQRGGDSRGASPLWTRAGPWTSSRAGRRCVRGRRPIRLIRPVRPSAGAGGPMAGDSASQKGGRRVSFIPSPASLPSRSGAMTPFLGRAGTVVHPKVTRRPPFSAPPAPRAATAGAPQRRSSPCGPPTRPAERGSAGISA